MINETAQLLEKAIKKSSISPKQLGIGDLIIVTGASDDIVGFVKNLNDSNDEIEVDLITASGPKFLKLSNKNFIHLLKRADMLDLREHHDYDRELKDMQKDTHGAGKKNLAERPEYGPVEDSKKSNLPTSKISLNLRKNQK